MSKGREWTATGLSVENRARSSFSENDVIYFHTGKSFVKSLETVAAGVQKLKNISDGEFGISTISEETQ